MSGVWKFKNNVIRLVENPEVDGVQGSSSCGKVLVHLPSGEEITSNEVLAEKLLSLGWERYQDGDPELLQFNKRSSIDLISLPMDFNKFSSVYMYDIVVKNPNMFQVRDKIIT